MLVLREAEPKDIELLYKWKNDPVARKMSFDSRVIPFEEHKEWFTNAIVDLSKRIYLGINESGESIGVARIDKKQDGSFEIAINVAPEHRGKGYGTTLIREASLKALREGFCKRIVAKIRNLNLTSIKAFEKAGYKDKREISNDSILLYFEAGY